MRSNTTKKKNPWKLFTAIIIVILILVALAVGILYMKIYEPGKRSSDFGRLQQESYQGIFLSMSAPEAFPEDIYPTYMAYDAVCGSHRIASFSDLSDYLETAFSSGNEVTHVLLVLDPLSLWNSNLHSDTRFSASLDEDLRRCRIHGHFLCAFPGILAGTCQWRSGHLLQCVPGTGFPSVRQRERDPLLPRPGRMADLKSECL